MCRLQYETEIILTRFILKSMGKYYLKLQQIHLGFAHDESQGTMGEKLMLPEQYEPQRELIEQNVLPFEVRTLE